MIEHLLPATGAPRITNYSAAGGYRSYVRVWDVARPAARVVCLHGIISHGGWYLQSCQRLADAGCEVHYLERRGSGLNAEQRGDVDQYQTWIEDVTTYLQQLPSDVPPCAKVIAQSTRPVAHILCPTTKSYRLNATFGRPRQRQYR